MSPSRRKILLRCTPIALGLTFLALAPATALASHFTGSTKECNTPTGQYLCRLNINIMFPPSTPNDVITVQLQGNATYASTPTRTAGTCPTTGLTLVNATTLNLPITGNITSPCTIVLLETLTATGAGGFPCQVIDLQSGENFPPLVACATLASPPIRPPLPTTTEECKNGGWKTFGTAFKNQGDCVSFVATGGKNPPSEP